MKNKYCIELKTKISNLTSGPQILKALEAFSGNKHINEYENVVNFAHRHMKKVDHSHWHCLRNGFGKIVLKN